MTTAPGTDRHARRDRHTMPGHDAGRMIDGVDLVVDGRPAGRVAPRWIRQLELAGYDAASDGPVSFALRTADQGPWTSFDDVRAALRAASEVIATSADAAHVVIEARTPTGRSVEVVAGIPVIGMAMGALDDVPIRVIEGPSLLPQDP